MGKICPAIAGFEDGERGQEPRNVGALYKLRKAKK